MTMPAKPCPFCGSHRGEIVHGTTYRWRVYRCSECDTRGPEIARIDIWTDEGIAACKAEAIAAWNERKEPQT